MLILSFHFMSNSVTHSLHSVLLSSKSCKPEISISQWKYIVKGFTSGLHYIHEKCGIIHNNLKEDNIVLQQDNDNPAQTVLQELDNVFPCMILARNFYFSCKSKEYVRFLASILQDLQKVLQGQLARLLFKMQEKCDARSFFKTYKKLASSQQVYFSKPCT